MRIKKKETKQYSVMAHINSYPEFVDYCLRRLGAPTIDINLDPEQIRDRISDAIQLYLETDSESLLDVYWCHQATHEDAMNGYLQMPMEVIGVSNVFCPNKNFNASIQKYKSCCHQEKVTHKVNSNGYSTDKNPYGDIPTNFNRQVISPEGKVVDWNIGTVDFGDDEFMTSYLYNWWNNYWNYGYNMYAGNGSLFYYEISMQYISLLKQLFCNRTEFSYRNRQRKLWLMSEPIIEGSFYCIHGHKILDPETDDCIWESPFLQAYATCLLGIQWGVNLSKFGSIPAAAGLTINSDQILQRYMEEKTNLEEAHRKKNQYPPKPMVG